MPAAWSIEEVEVTVAEYFAMLKAEIAGIPYTKTFHNERARQRLNNRTKASVEFKFQNISAVLVNHGHAYVKGYLPAQNYQAALETSVLEWIAGEVDLLDVVSESVLVNPPEPLVQRAYLDIVVDPPEPKRAARASHKPVPVRVDFVRLDAENRRLGLRGEEFVVELEQRRLHDDERRRDLARKVRWVARDEGDGLGYDISSFEGNGRPRLIEVKTTASGKYFPFALTRNELAVSKTESETYHLYRLYDFGKDPRMFVLKGALDESCALTPTQFQAAFSK